METQQKKIHVYLASPRGFCAGVDRAIQIVERVLELYGAPVYVRHEIVHNRHVVERLQQQGVRFVDHLSQVPDGYPAVFSAHGVPRSVIKEANDRDMFFFDATCPLVLKVHLEVRARWKAGYEIIMIGHHSHPEVIGTMGQIPDPISLVENVKDARSFTPRTDKKLAYVTQTTLSFDDTKRIINELKQRFPDITGPNKNDICYATMNRQHAVRAIAQKSDLVLVIGSSNSSNSKRLVEVSRLSGCPSTVLIEDAAVIQWEWFDSVHTVGLTAGASAPERLVQEVLAVLSNRFEISTEEIQLIQEDVEFKLPASLQKDKAFVLPDKEYK